MKKNIGMIIYANPDYYPPVINAIQILAKESDLVVICRNQDKPQFIYPKNVKLYRLGKSKTAREKETQSVIVKFFEYIVFIIYTIFYIRFYLCQLIYSYDMHGFVAGFLASRLIKRIPLIYHNLDIAELKETKGPIRIIKFFELRFASYAEKIVFPDIERARFFQKKGKLNKLPDIVMNAPLLMNQLPANRLKEILLMKGFNVDAKVVLYQGAINNAHSILEIIHSMLFWPKDTILVLLEIVNNDFLKELDNIILRLDLDKRVLRLPMVPYSELFHYTVGAYIGLALYKPTDVNQKFNLGASNKIFEYISMGIPVITNNSPYFRAILDSSMAYFAEPTIAEDIGYAINLAISDEEEYRKKSQVARQSHLVKFNYEEQFKPVVEYIQKVTSYLTS